MPELRQDPVVGYWTIIATERSRRPVEFVSRDIAETRRCPFCEGREKETTEEICAVRPHGTPPDTPGWQVRTFLSQLPILSMSQKRDRQDVGLQHWMEGSGQHELIIESPRHIASLDELSLEDVASVIGIYARRINDLEKERFFKYALLFKNHGLISGSARDVIRHTRSQLIGMPVTPKRVKEELSMTRRYFAEKGHCVFCDVLRQELRDNVRIVEESEYFVAFCPFASRQPFEIWLLPKKHAADFGRIEKGAVTDLAKLLKQSLLRIKTLLSDPPYNFILHTAPFRHEARPGYWTSIERDYHWYLQISPRLTYDAGFEWGSGVHINPTPPEEAAYLLRQTKEL